MDRVPDSTAPDADVATLLNISEMHLLQQRSQKTIFLCRPQRENPLPVRSSPLDESAVRGEVSGPFAVFFGLQEVHDVDVDCSQCLQKEKKKKTWVRSLGRDLGLRVYLTFRHWVIDRPATTPTSSHRSCHPPSLSFWVP